MMSNSKMNALRSGTTIVGIKGKDFVVLLAERQSTLDHIIASLRERKVYLVNDKIAFAGSGLVGDIQFVLKALKLQLEKISIERNKVPGVDVAKNILSNILYYRYYNMPFAPHYLLCILGGINKENKFELVGFDPVGGITENENFLAYGSGSELAMGVLEEHYTEDISLEDAIKLGIRAINSAKKRDVYSGGDIDTAVITRQHAKIYEGREVDSVITKE